ncbi:MAG: hypothetical protein P1V51_05355 [Deltaproteobacteria bacterium]|nr:hypothetical protein [Deltaproteobacteria bacterium]
MGVDFSHWRSILEEVYGGGRRWLLAGDVLAPLTGLAATLGELGAGECFRLASSRGTGPLPEGQDHLALDLGVNHRAGQSLMDAIRAGQRALLELPLEALERIEAFDSAREARVIGTIFDDGNPVAGREKFGRRRPEWIALEDKTVLAPLWAAAGVEAAPERIVPGDAGSLLRAHAELDALVGEGLGTVWAGDNTEGWHGGAEATFWVPDDEAARETSARIAGRFEKVRIMPFLDGIPCSIHGVVFPDHVVALRPCEMIVLRRPDHSGLVYARAATFWDPPAADREVMRRAAKRVGAHLRESVGFRGAFTIDGVMSAGGFRPTELNPRFGAALGVMSRGVDLPLMLTFLAVVEGVEADWRPEALEEALLTAADESRSGAGGGFPQITVSETREALLRFEEVDGALRAELLDKPAEGAAEPEGVDADVLLGPGPGGGYLNIALRPGRTPVGPSAAPRIAAGMACVDRAWSLGMGPAEAAPEHRPGTPGR